MATADASRVVLGLGGLCRLRDRAHGRCHGAARRRLRHPRRGADVAGHRDRRAGPRACPSSRYVARGGGRRALRRLRRRRSRPSPAASRTAPRWAGRRCGPAIVMDRLGVPSTLHLVTINDTVRRLLPPSSDYVSSAVRGHLLPAPDRPVRQGHPDPCGDLDITAPFANRLIYVNDPANESMALSRRPGRAAAPGDDLPGLRLQRHAGRGPARPAARRAARRTCGASAGRDGLLRGRGLPRAGASAGGCGRRLLDEIDVYGLNEDEMQAYLGRPVDLLSVREVADALAEVHALISGTHPGAAHEVLGGGARRGTTPTLSTTAS